MPEAEENKKKGPATSFAEQIGPVLAGGRSIEDMVEDIPRDRNIAGEKVKEPKKDSGGINVGRIAMRLAPILIGGLLAGEEGAIAGGEAAGRVASQEAAREASERQERAELERAMRVAEAQQKQRLDELLISRQLQGLESERQRKFLAEQQAQKLESQKELEQTKASMKEREKEIASMEERRKADVPGFVLKTDVIPEKSEVKDLREASVQGKKLMSQIEHLQGLLDKYNTQVLPTKGKRLLEQATRDLQLTYKGKDFAGLGVLTGPDLDLLESVIPKTTGIGAVLLPTSQIQAALDQLKTQASKNIALKAESLGYAPITGEKQIMAGDMGDSGKKVDVVRLRDSSGREQIATVDEIRAELARREQERAKRLAR